MTVFSGGLRIGLSHWVSINYTRPFAKAAFEEQFLRIAAAFIVWKKEYILPYDSITKVSSQKGVFSSGVRIEHHSRNIPPYILFWTKRSDAFLKEFAEHCLPEKN